MSDKNVCGHEIKYDLLNLNHLPLFLFYPSPSSYIILHFSPAFNLPEYIWNATTSSLPPDSCAVCLSAKHSAQLFPYSLDQRLQFISNGSCSLVHLYSVYSVAGAGQKAAKNLETPPLVCWRATDYFSYFGCYSTPLTKKFLFLFFVCL